MDVLLEREIYNSSDLNIQYRAFVKDKILVLILMEYVAMQLIIFNYLRYAKWVTNSFSACTASQTLCSHKALMDWWALKSVYYIFSSHLMADTVANNFCLSPVCMLRKDRLPVAISCWPWPISPILMLKIISPSVGPTQGLGRKKGHWYYLFSVFKPA